MRIAFARRASTILYNLLVGRGDRRPFLLPANICPIVPITFLKAGVPFEFVDLSPLDWQMDLNAADSLLASGGYGGLLYAHTYGEPSTPRDFFRRWRGLDASLLLIDDRCLCPPQSPAEADDAAHVSLYSSGYAKFVDLGFGGYAFLAEDVPYRETRLPFDPEALRALEAEYKRVVAAREPYRYRDSDWLETEPPDQGWEEYWRLVSGAIPSVWEHRRALNEIYESRLPAGLSLPPAYQNWRYNLLVPDKERVLRAIFAAGLFASSHYASLAGIFAPGRCPQAEALAGRVVNLFNDRHYTAEMAEQTCEVILKCL